MAMNEEDKSRIDKLEELCAHQSMEIEQLSETVREQWEKLDQLMKAMLRLRDRLSEVEDSSSGPHVNTKPPHY